MKFSSPVLVTGASGFVGSHLAEKLAQNGVKVNLLVRKTSKIPFKVGPQIQLCYGDVTDRDSVVKAAQGVKVIYHLAGILRGSSFKKLNEVNAEGTRNVCEAALKVKGLKRLVYVSSLSAAGPSRDGKPLKENLPCQPVSLYGVTKFKGEEIAQAYGKRLPLTILRPGAVYGPRETDIFAYFKMVKDGWVLLPSLKQEVSFVHVQDLVNAILLAGHSPKAVGQVYFVSDGIPYSWQELTREIGKATSRKFRTIPIPMGVVRIVAYAGELAEKISGKASLLNVDKVKEAFYTHWTCDNGKIRAQLGFKPQWNLEKGVRDAASFYQQEGWIKG
jgi:nucleoside-diphosphate-sugar epimerase